ncbi:MAG: hypothetical protein Kow0074_12500 [Candidatus Zixiibacteriota bacterium]
MTSMLRHSAVTVIVGLVLWAGCTENSVGPNDTARLKLGFALTSNELASAVELVTLTIDYPDTTITDTLELIDGEINDTLTIPIGTDLIFTLRAYSAGGTLLYMGTDTQDALAGEVVLVDIQLTPVAQILMLRVGPLYQSAALDAGDQVEVFVDIHNVDPMFGVAFRLVYDTTILDFDHSIRGTFVRGDPAVPTLEGVVKDSLDYVAYAATRVRTGGTLPSPVSGSGRIATFVFDRVGIGSSFITIHPETVVLEQADGQPVGNISALILESATVEVLPAGGE